MSHPLNFTVGWWLILAAFLTGAIVGLGFHRQEFLGGYDSFRRRLVRLGHIALAALGMMNVLYGLSPTPPSRAGPLLIAGAIAMPLVCFLAAWRPVFRHVFFIPVILLIGSVALILLEVRP